MKGARFSLEYRPMSFVIDCPCCTRTVTAEPELIGRVMACPYCARHFTIPQMGAAPVRVAAPASNYGAVHDSIRFTFTCQRCGSILEARGGLCGKQGRCPTCGATFIVPEVDQRTGLPLGPAVVANDGQLPTPMHAYATAGDRAPKILRRDDGSQVIECPRCRRHQSIDSNICDSCGMPFTMEGAAAIVEYSSAQSNGLATASLTLGIISLFIFCAPGLGLVPMILGGLAIQKSTKMGTLAPGRGIAISGIVCGGISLLWVLQYL